MPDAGARPDFLVIGAGIVGVTIALELRRRYPTASISVLEKELALGAHTSGRNSGVLHAGFYYGADSLKARFTREGNARLTAYCAARKLAINRCGKLVVAADERDLPGLDELLRRAKASGVALEEVPEERMHEIEPRARTVGRALYSPTTASVDPVQVLESLARDAREEGIAIVQGGRYTGRAGHRIATSAGTFQPGYVVNAAGLHADSVARDFGFSERYRILPFKGIYLYGAPGEVLRTHVYPVPNLANPFLGVHFTVTVGGRAKIGPTAIPAFWREQYAGLHNFNLREFGEILAREAGLLARNDFGFRDLAAAEIGKYRRRTLARLAGRLVDGVDPARYREWGRAGIRAQLLDIRERRLEMDFRIEGDDRSMHVLNAVSPAFTAAMPFAEHVADRIQAAVG